MTWQNIFEAVRVLGHDEDYEPGPAEEPTDAVPGSEAKIRVLSDRVLRGQSLWHPRDKRDLTNAGPDDIRRRCGKVVDEWHGALQGIRTIDMDEVFNARDGE